jgi:hypothetical protein
MCFFVLAILFLTFADCPQAQALNAVMIWLFFLFKVRRMLTDAKTQIDRKTERQRETERHRDIETER